MVEQQIQAVKTAELHSTTSSDWRVSIPEHKRRHLRWWLWTGAALTVLIVVIGGITRLTDSGLSMVEWEPILGVLPPMNDAEWAAAFDQYRQFPEYQRLRAGMPLAEFKFIYWWEYVHRMAARLIGIVFIVPFLFFAARRYLNAQLTGRLLVLFGLGAGQGVMGWYMVTSGLVDIPAVSHYRLAAHLMFAFAIFGTCLWLALQLGARPGEQRRADSFTRVSIGVMGAVLLVQVVWGAFVAGLKAGLFYNTFPLMGGRLIPSHMITVEPAILSFFENAIAVQWMHRVLGTILLILAAVVFVRAIRRQLEKRTVRWAGVFFALVAVQYLLGILTLLMMVPLSLGVIHQTTALILFGAWLVWVHREFVRRPAVAATRGDG